MSTAVPPSPGALSELTRIWRRYEADPEGAPTLRSFDAVCHHIAARTRGGGPVRAANDEVATLELDDGRVFELSSRPQLAADRVVGRVWSFRDVTAQRHRTP